MRRASVFSEEPPGTVVAQDPAGDERAPLGSSVRINVSKGTNRVEVPDVVGRTAAEAGSILSSAGLGSPRVFTVPSARSSGEVVAQSPAAGSEVARGESIRINVSDGTGAPQLAEEVEVPDVVGQPEETGVEALEDAGFSVRIRREETGDPAQSGIVVEQEPAAGETAKAGDEVLVVVGDEGP